MCYQISRSSWNLFVLFQLSLFNATSQKIPTCNFSSLKSYKPEKCIRVECGLDYNYTTTNQNPVAICTWHCMPKACDKNVCKEFHCVRWNKFQRALSNNLGAYIIWFLSWDYFIILSVKIYVGLSFYFAWIFIENKNQFY